MNKIKLIKSFAGYPVWVYVNIWPAYANESCWQYDNGFKYNAWYFEIHNDIVEWMKQNFEEVKERPTSWEELWEIKWYFIGMDSDIGKTDGIFYSADSNKNIFLTKQQCEASLALAQITQLLDKYDIPEESYEWYYYAIGWYSDEHRRRQSTNHQLERQWLLWFDTEEKRDHFYKHHADLISKLAPFYIF